MPTCPWLAPSRAPVSASSRGGAFSATTLSGGSAASSHLRSTIINWTIDRTHHRAVPTMSNGTQGAVLELRDLFEQFLNEAVLGAVDQAVQDAAKTKLLSPLY